MPLLITGSPGTPLTPAALDHFRSHPTGVFVVPTATMAEHLRHVLARAGDAVRPSAIQTLAGFLDTHARLRAAPAAWAHWLLERALERQRPVRFREVAEFPGFVRRLAGLFDLAPAQRYPDEVARLFAEVETELAARGCAPRHARLRAVAEQAPGLAPVVFDGFFKLSAGEAALITELARRSEVTLTLPEWPGSERTLAALRGAGWREERVESPAPSSLVMIRALNMEREIDEIARRILEQAARGRPFREMGVVLRARDPYGPLVEATLARCGIPFRSYFIDTLDTHPAIQFRAGVVRAALAGWDHEAWLPALRLPASGLGGTQEGDALDFRLREKLPDAGWPQTGGLDARARREPGEWAARLKALREWAPALVVEDGASIERIRAWRSTAAAERGWDAAVDSVTQAQEGSGAVTLSEFWKPLETVLAQEPLRVPDTRRNVVHILDAYEARQWSLPVVFVAGLIERHFPQYHREDPIVGDTALRRAGLDTAGDREQEEQFLYALAASRATEQTILSYPQYDERGQETLPSFFLPEQKPEDVGTPLRPLPVRAATMPPSAPIQDEGLRARLAERHTALSPTAVETYLQCPFQFFVKKTLRLVERPKAPRDRLNVLTQGNILHAALAEWVALPLLGAGALDHAFDSACREKNVPRTYRAEAVRLELLRNFEAFTSDLTVHLPGWERKLEEWFEFALHGSLRLRGKIDRLEIGPRKSALVIDYKYSGDGKLKQRLQDTASGDAVQAGVYLLAAERHFGLRAAGMLYCHVKNQVAWGGWHSGIEGLEEVGERRTAEGIGELASIAEREVLRVHQEIVGGNIEVRPADQNKCAWCEARHMCRVESMEQVREAGA